MTKFEKLYDALKNIYGHYDETFLLTQIGMVALGYREITLHNDTCRFIISGAFIDDDDDDDALSSVKIAPEYPLRRASCSPKTDDEPNSFYIVLPTVRVLNDEAHVHQSTMHYLEYEAALTAAERLSKLYDCKAYILKGVAIVKSTAVITSLS